jgi:mannose-6-phosphate isomerase-like protein (cupin superfamily)
MTPVDDIRDLLPLYALGVLSPEEHAIVEAAVAKDPALAAELASYSDAAPALIEPITPSAEVKARLMASIGESRFETYSKKMATMFDVSVDRAREFLGLAERSASWEVQPVPGIHLVHFDGGPAYAAADCGFVRLADGAVFPPHKHLGEEVSLILSGQLRVIAADGTEQTLGVGDELVLAQGTTHHLVAIGECIFAARAMNGIEIGGAPVRPKPDR